MKFLSLLCIIVLLLISSCTTNEEPTKSETNFNGYLYYAESSNIIKRLNLNTMQSESLFNFANDPEMLTDGSLLCVERYAKQRIMRTNLTGANRETIVEMNQSFSTPHQYYLNRPRISPNQEMIAYTGDAVSYVVTLNGGNLLATIGDYYTNNLFNPSWGADGSIYLQGEPSKNNGIFKASGANFAKIERVDKNLTNVSQPSVNPAGTKIAFIKDGKLWIMEIDGSNPTQLYTADFNLYIPTWSPDGRYIATVSSPTSKIYIINVENKTGTEVTSLSNAYAFHTSQLSWSDK